MPTSSFGAYNTRTGYLSSAGNVYSDGFSVLQGRATANGQHPIHIDRLYTAASGRGGSRTFTITFGSASWTGALAAAANAQDTGWLAASWYVANGTTARLTIAANGGFHFGRSSLSGANGVIGSFGNFTGTLGGVFAYSQAPLPPSAPALVRGAGSGAVDVSWAAPDDGGSAITGYVVEYADNALFTGSDIVAAAGLSTALSGLTPGTTYYVRVAARNAVTDEFGTTSLHSAASSVTVLSGGQVQAAGAWKPAIVKVRVAGVWKDAIVKVRASGVWKDAV